MDKLNNYQNTTDELVKKLADLKSFARDTGIDISQELDNMEKKLKDSMAQAISSISRWQRVEMARLKARPTFLDYISLIFDDFIELHGDRNFGDDKAIITGIGMFENTPVTIIGQQKGRDTKENIERNFGMPNPEGYRKALRHMKLAEKFKRPVICFIDTSGAYPGLGAEERGQGQAIAANLMEMSSLSVPTISIVIGEGGSGGALALGVASVVMMLENSIYSVISPEGFASIIFKDSSKAKEAADILKLTANDLFEFGIIDKIIEEAPGGAHRDINFTAQNIKRAISSELNKLALLSADELIDNRYRRFRNIGAFKE